MAKINDADVIYLGLQDVVAVHLGTEMVWNLAAPPINLSVPTVSGATTEGDTATATTGSWTGSPTSYAYQWQEFTGGVWVDVSGETASTFDVDVAGTYRVEVVATNAEGDSSPAYSLQFIVAAPGGALTTWDPVTAGANGTLSAGNTIYTYGSGTAANVITAHPILVPTYFEVRAILIAGETGWPSLYAGASKVMPTSNLIGQSYSEPGMSMFGRPYSDDAVWLQGLTGAFSTYLVLHGSERVAALYGQIAVSGRDVWVKTDKMGGWYGGGDPAAGTSPSFTFPGSADIYGAGGVDDAGETVELLHPDDYLGTPPAGFRAGIAG